jgi:alkanesulfonate monooxygenase SsuD/methylene tetrahydromethanopterin reductase-like flavin-dependent oxidoreductase (luciferase family)
LLLLTAVGLGLYARHWLSLAGRSRVGARSEDEVQRALAPLQAEGWRLRHSLPWQGQGDIDSVAIAPTGIAAAVDTKTRTYDGRHLAWVREQAAWLSRRRRMHEQFGKPPGNARLMLTGTPDEVMARLGEYADAGVDRVVLGTLLHRDLEHIELLGSGVAQELAS